MKKYQVTMTRQGKHFLTREVEARNALEACNKVAGNGALPCDQFIAREVKGRKETS